MTIIKRLTKKPEGNIWKRLFIYSVFIQYFGVATVMSLVFMQLGLLAPEADVSESIISASQKIADVYESVMTKFFHIGQDIALNNPITSKILAFALAHLVWVFYFGIAILALDVIRHIVWWIMNKIKVDAVQEKQE